MERNLNDVITYNNIKKAINTLEKYNISYTNEDNKRLVFTLDNETYTFQGHLNRVYKGVHSTDKTLIKFLKSLE